MVEWTLKYTNKVAADSSKLKRAGLEKKVQRLLAILKEDPFKKPPYFEKLFGFENVYSRRINIKHRLVYQVFKEEKIVKVVSLWGHYDDNG